jgi:two-component system sensor histidine kinase TctE
MKKKFALISRTSLRGQLFLWSIGPLFLIGVIAIYDGYRAARQTADSVSDRVLSGSALAIAERVFVNEDNALEVDIPYVALQMLTSSEDDRVFYRIEDAKGDFVTGYRGLSVPKSQLELDEVSFTTGVFRGAAIRIASYSGAAASNTKSLGFRVIIAETTNARSAIARSILVRSLLRQAALLIAAAILVLVVVTRALQPLQKVEEAIGRRSADDVRPIEHQVPDEVQGLVSTINQLVNRFASSIRALENFTSNTSHQFRTPLALIKTHLEVAVREKDQDKSSEAIRQAHTAVGDAERLMAQLLLLARLDAVSKEEIQAATCDLTTVAREVCEEFFLRLSHSANENIDLGFEGAEPIWVFADQTLVQEVVRNLIDNAIKHGGKTTKIDVNVSRQQANGVLSVYDNGNGFDPKIINANTEDVSISANTSIGKGTGIGLSIVKEIVELFGGKLAASKTAHTNGMVVKAAFKLTK